MSVRQCDRMGCEGIMCDRLSHTYGYICNECFTELIIRRDISIEEFMNSEKENGQLSDFWPDYCDKEFPDMDAT